MGSNIIIADPILKMFGSLVLIVKNNLTGNNIVGTSGYDDDDDDDDDYDDDDDDDDGFLTWYTPHSLLKTRKTTPTKKHKNCPTTSLLPSSSSILVYFFWVGPNHRKPVGNHGWLDFPPHPLIPKLPKRIRPHIHQRVPQVFDHSAPEGVRVLPGFLCLENPATFDIFISKSHYEKFERCPNPSFLLSNICWD